MDITKKSVLNGYLYEITEEDALSNLKSYSLDNPNFILYISNHNDNSFETSFKEYIKINNLKDSIIYLNGWNKLDNSFAELFKKEFSSNLLRDISLISLKQSNIYIFKDGKVIDVLYRKRKDINIEDVRAYLESIGDTND